MMRVGIVGLGLIGGSLGKALRKLGADLEVAGVDCSAQIVHKAREAGAADRTSTEPGILRGTDIVVIATPIDEIPGVLDTLSRTISAPSLITDVASVKARVLDGAACLPSPTLFLGGHPLAGKTRSGLEESEASIFAGRPWIFTPADGQDLDPFAPWFELVRAIGAEPVFMSAAEHDRQMAYLSHLAFTLSSAYAQTVGQNADPSLGGPGYQGMVRLASGDAVMYEAICLGNRSALLQAIDDFSHVLAVYRDRIARGDGVRALFTQDGNVAV